MCRGGTTTGWSSSRCRAGHLTVVRSGRLHGDRGRDRARDIPDTAAAFAAYKKLRRERVERVVKYGKRSGDGKAPGRVGPKIRHLMLNMIMRRREAGTSLSWLYDGRIDWSAPVTAAR